MNAMTQDFTTTILPWCVLKCAGPSTLSLIRSLSREGYEVWTPVEMRTRRVVRANVKRRIESAMMPGYIFARSDRLPDLLMLAKDPTSEHRGFSVFRERDRCPLIADEALAPLRLEERKVQPAPEGLKVDDEVRLTDGAYAGLRGTVVKGGSKFAMIRIPGFHTPLKVAAYYLLRDESGSGKMLAA